MGMEAHAKLRQQANHDMGVERTPSRERGPSLREGPLQVVYLQVISQCPHVHQVTRMLGTAFSGALGWVRCPAGGDTRPPQWSMGVIRPGDGWLGKMS